MCDCKEQDGGSFCEVIQEKGVKRIEHVHIRYCFVLFIFHVLCADAGGQDSGIHQQTSPVQQTSVHFEAPVAAPIVQQQQQQAPTSPHPVTAANADATFRQPLPPALARPRLPSPGSVVIRGPTGVRHPLQGLDPRLQVTFCDLSA